MIADFLRESLTALEEEKGGFVWNGWQSAVALLGIEDLVPLVKAAFELQLIDPHWLAFRNFEEDLQNTLQRPDEISPEYRPFGDAIEEFSNWHGFSQAFVDEQERARAARAVAWSRPEQVFNSHRHVGRNDPCPCGSGRKFKKCCLAEAA